MNASALTELPRAWRMEPLPSVLSRLNTKKHQVLSSEYLRSGTLAVVDQGKNFIAGYTDRMDKRLKCPQEGVIVFGDHTRVVKYVDFDFAVGAEGTQVLVAHVGQNTRFLAYVLQNNPIPDTGYNRHFKFLQEMWVPVPPLEEQLSIAEVLGDVDALIEGIERLISKKREMKQGAMQQLLSGQTRLPGFTGKWPVKPFKWVAEPRRERFDPAKENGAHPFCIELEHLGSRNGRLLGHTSTEPSSSLKTVFRPNDVLFGKLRAYLGKYWLANRGGVCSTEIWALSAASGTSPAFVYQVVQQESFIDAASNSYGTHMPRSDWGVVGEFEVGLPPLLEQHAIAAVLSDMDAEIEALETRLEKTRLMKQGMMQELLSGRVRLL